MADPDGDNSGKAVPDKIDLQETTPLSEDVPHHALRSCSHFCSRLKLNAGTSGTYWCGYDDPTHASAETRECIEACKACESHAHYDCKTDHDETNYMQDYYQIQCKGPSTISDSIEEKGGANSHLSIGMVVIIAIGAAFGASIITVIVWFVYFRLKERKKKKKKKNEEGGDDGGGAEVINSQTQAAIKDEVIGA